MNPEFSLKSMVDDFGRVFFNNGEVFRVINNDKEAFCRELIQSGFFKELESSGLFPKTSISELIVPGYNLVLHHEKLLEGLQHEWSFNMLKDAALTVLKINKTLNKYGYELKDAHTMNVLFRGTQPVFIDIGSISKKTSAEENNWIAYEEFLGSFIVPLIFWQKGMNYITRKLLESNFHRMFTLPSQSLVDSGLITLIKRKESRYEFKIRKHLIISQRTKSLLLEKITRATQSSIKSIFHRNTQIFSYENVSPKFKSLNDYFPYEEIEKDLEMLNPPEQETTWQYYHEKNYVHENNPVYSARFLRIMSLIKERESEINSVIDLAGNEGLFCRLLNQETNIKTIILADYDENAVDKAYLSFRKENNKRVQSLLLNFMFTPDLRGTFERLRSDIVIALAISHHLTLSQHFSINTIFERIRNFSRRYVMIEFMPLGLWSATGKNNPVPPKWYNEEWFRNNYEKYFKIISIEKLEENRVLFFGIIK